LELLRLELLRLELLRLELLRLELLRLGLLRLGHVPVPPGHRLRVLGLLDPLELRLPLRLPSIAAMIPDAAISNSIAAFIGSHSAIIAAAVSC